MTSLESIALPLTDSRSLVEQGIVLETAMVWVTVEIGEHNPMPPTLTINYHLKSMYPVYPAPVLSELLDAIREKVGDESWCELFWGKKSHLEVLKTNTDSDDDLLGEGEAPTDLLAAAALLMEVTK
jgi:hypothetical protein